MLKRQIHAQNRYQSLLNVMGTFINSWSGNTSVNAIFNTLTNHLKLLNEAGANQKNNSKGITQSKAQSRAELIQIALIHSAAGMSYAAGIKDTTLKINSRITPSTLIRASDIALDDICQSLYNLLIPYAPLLNNFGANAASFVAFQIAITAYQSISQLPKNARSTKKTATLNIKTQLNAMRSLVKEQLDPIMFQYKTIDPDFYNQYMGLRHTIHGKSRIKTVIIQADVKTSTGAVLENAAIKLISSKGAKRNKFSKADGNQHFTRLKPDVFTITVSLPGYITQTKNIEVNAPQKLNLHIIMNTDASALP